jgi:hypothetical protein
MSKKNKSESPQERVSDWLSSLRFKDLKRAAIMRGYPFHMVGTVGVQALESFILSHYHDRVNPNLLVEFDRWCERTLVEEGAIDSPIHIDLKLGFYAIDEEGNEKRKRRDINLMGVVKSEEEIATFRPRKGSKKTLVFDLMEEGLKTQEIISRVQDEYPDTTEGTIKVWCSQARKKLKAKTKLGI